MDKAIEYQTKLQAFVDKLSKETGTQWAVETGRKFDKVYEGNRSGRYMVDRNSWVIYGIKSWAQINPRRLYGTLDTVEQWDWVPYYATPVVNTPAEKEYLAREAMITSNYKPRGRPRKDAP